MATQAKKFNKNSVAIELIKKLPNDISVYDPKVKLEKDINRYKQTNKVEEIYKKSKIIIIATPWPQFKSISNHLNFRKNKTVIIDHNFKFQSIFTKQN